MKSKIPMAMKGVLTSTLFLLLYSGVRPSVGQHVSSSVISLVGKSLRLFCGADGDGDPHYWEYSSMRENGSLRGWERFYNGIELTAVPERGFNWTQCNDSKQWCLFTNEANMSYGGLYKCLTKAVETTHDNSIVNSTEYIVKVIVLESNPECSLKKDDFFEGETIELSCSVKLGQTAPDPVVTWRRSKYNVVFEEDVRSFSSSNTYGSFSSEIVLNASVDLHNFKYSCMTFFNRSLKDNVIYDDNYEHVCTLPAIRIFYSPRNLKIWPSSGAVFSPGETVRCEADAYPDPVYEWIDKETSKVVFSGAQFVITTEMIRKEKYKYMCKVSNNISSVGAEKDFVFSVGERLTAAVIVTICLGILSCLLIFALLLIGHSYIKDFVSRLLARFQRNADVQAVYNVNGQAVRVDRLDLIQEGHNPGEVEGRPGQHYDFVGADNDIRYNSGPMAAAGCSRDNKPAPIYSQVAIKSPSRLRGADGTEYLELNRLRHLPPANDAVPAASRFEEMLYADIDHTAQPPPPKTQMR